MDGPTFEELFGLARALHIALVNLVVEVGDGKDTTTQIAQAEHVLDQSKELFGYWPPVPEGVPTGSVWSVKQQTWVHPDDADKVG